MNCAIAIVSLYFMPNLRYYTLFKFLLYVGGQGIGPVNTALSITFSLVVTLYIVAGVVVLAIVFGILCIIHYRGHEKVEPKCDHNTGSVTPTKDPVTATDIRSSALVEEV